MLKNSIKIILSASVFSTLLLSTGLFAEEAVEIPVTLEEKSDSSIHNFPLAKDIAGSNLEEQRDKYLKNKHKKLGFTRKGSYVGWGESSIETSSDSLDFGQKRVMAFEKAFSDAKAEFVRTKKQQVGVSIVRKFMNDDTDKPQEEVQDNKFLSIGKKLLAVSEAKLDNMLVDLGVDPKTIENSNIKSKRILAENSLNKEITIRAIQNIRGIKILATFEDTKGVGVLIVQAPKYAELAKAIASKKLVPYPSAEDPIDVVADKIDATFSDVNKLIPQYGVRIMLDDAGNRVLVSFGQWSPKVTNSDSKMKINMATKAAKQIAYEQALSYMTQFINTTLALDSKTKLQDSDTITQISRTDESEEINEKSSVGASINQFVKETSNVNIEGVATIKSWTTNHPDTGHLIVGKVLMWSPVTQEFARQKPKPKVTKSTTKKKVRVVKNKTYQSVDLGDDDF